MLLADAPTGTGKSASTWLRRSWTSPPRVVGSWSGVVPTATLAPQAQLLSQDIPPMRVAAAELMGYLEEGIDHAVLRAGRTPWA